MLVLIVTLDIDPERIDVVLERTLTSALSAALEPGCRRLDVIEDAETPSRIHLYEVYDDQAALDEHMRQPYFLEWQKMPREWYSITHRFLGQNIHPSDDDFR